MGVIHLSRLEMRDKLARGLVLVDTRTRTWKEKDIAVGKETMLADAQSCRCCCCCLYDSAGATWQTELDFWLGSILRLSWVDLGWRKLITCVAVIAVQYRPDNNSR